MSILPASCSKLVRSGLGAMALLALGLLGLGCGGSAEPTPAPPAAAAPAANASVPTPTPTPPPDPAKILDEMAGNLRNMESMRFAVTHNPGSIYVSTVSAKATEAAGTWQTADGADITIEAYLVAGPNADPETGTYVQLQIVVTPDGYFITDPLSGAWTKRPVDTVPIPITELANIMGDMVASITNATLAGEEELDGIDTYKITGQAPASVMNWLLLTPIEGQSVDVEIWTDRELKLLRQARIIGPINEYDVPDTVREIKLTDLNESISVEPPTDFLDLSQLQQ